MGKARTQNNSLLEQQTRLPKNTGGHGDVPPEVERAFKEQLDKGIAEDTAETRRDLQQSIITLTDRLATLKVQQTDQQIRLKGLCEERSRLLANGLPQASQNTTAIAQLRYELDCIPGTITELESQLSEQQKALAQFDRDQLVNAQKGRVAQLRSLSKELLSTLEQAVKVNRTLLNVWQAYLAEGISIDTKGTTGGSQGWLEILYGMLQAEVEKNQPRRPVVPVPPL